MSRLNRPSAFLPNSHDELRAAHVHAGGLFAVTVLARRDDCFQMLRVEETRRGDVEGIELVRLGHGRVRLGSLEHQSPVDAGVAFLRRNLIEVLFARFKFVGEKVAERHVTRAGVVGQYRRHVRAARAATEQSHAQRGIGRGAAHQARFHNHEASHGCRGYEFSAPELLGFFAHRLVSPPSVAWTVMRIQPIRRSQYTFSFLRSSICCGPSISLDIEGTMIAQFVVSLYQPREPHLLLADGHLFPRGETGPWHSARRHEDKG